MPGWDRFHLDVYEGALIPRKALLADFQSLKLGHDTSIECHDASECGPFEQLISLLPIVLVLFLVICRRRLWCAVVVPLLCLPPFLSLPLSCPCLFCLCCLVLLPLSRRTCGVSELQPASSDRDRRLRRPSATCRIVGAVRAMLIDRVLEAHRRHVFVNPVLSIEARGRVFGLV